MSPTSPATERHHRAKLLLPFLFVLLGGAACDPQNPGAVGQVTFSSAASTDGGLTLEVRAYPDDGRPLDPATTNLTERDWLASESIPLAGIEGMSIRYGVIGPMGYTEQQRWRVVAWIAMTPNVERPLPGEWYGTRLFELGECGGVFPDFCGVTHGTDIEIDRRVGVSGAGW